MKSPCRPLPEAKRAAPAAPSALKAGSLNGTLRTDSGNSGGTGVDTWPAADARIASLSCTFSVALTTRIASMACPFSWFGALLAVPIDVVAQMRSSPMWPTLEGLAHTLAYDGAIMGDSMSGSPLPIERWASVTAPTLVLDGGASPSWARNAVQALADVLPDVRRRSLEEQDHGPAPEVLAPMLGEFFAA